MEMITFSYADKKPDLRTSKPPPQDSPQNASHEALKETQVSGEMNSVPKVDLLNQLES